MIKLGGLVNLKPLREAEDDKYVSIGFGKFKEKGKEDDKNAPTFKKDGNKFVPLSGDDSPSSSDTKKDTPKVNIFSKDKEEPKKDEPKSEPKKLRQGNPQVNKAVKAKADKLGITPQKLGKEEYQKKMSQAAVEALTDSNFHSEARELIAKLEGKPEWAEDPRKSAPKIDSPDYDKWRKNSVYSSEYYDHDDATGELAHTASEESGWGGVEAADSIAFTLRMNGFHKLADTIQSVFDNKGYMKQEGRISLKKLY